MNFYEYVLELAKHDPKLRKLYQEEQASSEKAYRREMMKAADDIHQLKTELKELSEKATKNQSSVEESDKVAEGWKNKYYEAFADLSNARKMLDKEVENEKKFALKEMIKEIIPIIDTFDVAFKKRIEDEVVRGYVEGFKIIYNKLCNLLKAKQVEIVIPTIGEEYNPTYMEAIQVSEGPENNKVMDLYGKAFILHDVVLRPARVIISKAIKHN